MAGVSAVHAAGGMGQGTGHGHQGVAALASHHPPGPSTEQIGEKPAKWRTFLLTGSFRPWWPLRLSRFAWCASKGGAALRTPYPTLADGSSHPSVKLQGCRF